MNNTEYSQDEEDLLAQIGITLLLVQDLEHLMSHCLKMIFGDKTIIRLDDLFGEDRRNLGRLIKTLQKSVDLSSKFEHLLETVLEKRNLFVHRLRQQEWFDTQTEHGRMEVWKFVHDFYYELEELIMIFNAFAFRQANELNMPETAEVRILRERGFMQELEKHYMPRLDSLVSKRK